MQMLTLQWWYGSEKSMQGRAPYIEFTRLVANAQIKFPRPILSRKPMDGRKWSHPCRLSDLGRAIGVPHEKGLLGRKKRPQARMFGEVLQAMYRWNP